MDKIAWGSHLWLTRIIYAFAKWAELGYTYTSIRAKTETFPLSDIPYTSGIPNKKILPEQGNDIYSNNYTWNLHLTTDSNNYYPSTTPALI